MKDVVVVFSDSLSEDENARKEEDSRYESSSRLQKFARPRIPFCHNSLAYRQRLLFRVQG